MMLSQLLVRTIIAIGTLAVMAGCELFQNGEDGLATGDPIERRELPRALSSQEEMVSGGSGEFGFHLMQKLIESSPEESHFISPLSIVMAFGMVMNGAEGDTWSQMQKTFAMEGLSRNEMNEAARNLFTLLAEFDESVRFRIANSIWYRDTFEVEEDFLSTNEEYYNAETRPADFNDPATVSAINQWVDQQTEGLIDEIVKGPINPLTVMYLINAIYFQGDWSYQFDPDKTRKESFFRADGSLAEVDMMRLDELEGASYRTGDNYQAANLYYGDAGFAMTLVLPDEETGLEEWLREADWSLWQGLTSGFWSTTMTLEMPKFEMEYEIDSFPKLLEELGIVDAFNASLSDFSRINPDAEDLHITDARHKSFIRVDEEGTEAAAVTSVEIGVTSTPQTVHLRLDRPFFYVIREVESNTILFMGTMTGS